MRFGRILLWGIIYSLLIIISFVIHNISFNKSFSILQVLIILLGFIIGVISQIIHESSKSWSFTYKFASRFASYSVLLLFLGLLWQGTLGWFLMVPAPTYIIFMFGLMGNENPSIFDYASIYSYTIISSAIVWFIVGLIIGKIYSIFKKTKIVLA